MPQEKFKEPPHPVIIATKGLPCTGKSEIARCIAQWANCPLLYIDHFLDALSFENGYTAELLPSPEQAERLHHLSFKALCKAASDTLQWGVGKHYWGYKCVVVKSRLSSTFELDQVLQLARGRGCGTILIIEFRMIYEYRFRVRLESKVKSGGRQEWYKPRRWKDMDKAIDDYDANTWDRHLRHVLDTGDGLPRVTRLVVDPFDVFFLVSFASVPNLTLRIINFLLKSKVELEDDPLRRLLIKTKGDLFLKGRYSILHYTVVGRYLREEIIRGPRSTGVCGHKYICYACRQGCICKIRYWEELQNDDNGNTYRCGVCKKDVISGQSAYGCVFCTLTLHQLCAELSDKNVTLEGYHSYKDIEFLKGYPKSLPKQHACESCLSRQERFSSGCRSCNIQTHLKCGELPTILNHDCHKHFLFLNLGTHKCKACGTDRRGSVSSYGCYICDKKYDIECLSLVRKGGHQHGGHQHLLKLVYSRDGMEEEESYWCDICYQDIDPQNWFYCCQNCPNFSAHPSCARYSIRRGSLQTHPKAHRNREIG